MSANTRIHLVGPSYVDAEDEFVEVVENYKAAAASKMVSALIAVTKPHTDHPVQIRINSIAYLEPLR
jgi:hypothetical protein